MALFAEGKLFREAGTGTGGGDKHNKGYFVDETALTTAYPTGEAGDYAIVESTDTVWIWDSDNSEWVDSDQKGQVTSVNNQTGAVTVSEVPSQTGQSGKFLTTDGTDASWSDKAVVNNATGYYSIAMGNNSMCGDQNSVAIGNNARAVGPYNVAIGSMAGNSSSSGQAGQMQVAIGYSAKTRAYGAIQLGTGQNRDANTFKVGNDNGNYEMMSADGTIPADRLVHAINWYSTMPTASADNFGDIIQFTGSTDANYTNGYFYECVVASTTPASATIAQTTGNTLSDLTVDGETFWEKLGDYSIPQQTGDYAFTYDEGVEGWKFDNNYFDLEAEFGVTYTGTPADGDVLTISATAPSATYAWTRVDVQPAGGTYTAGVGIDITNNEIGLADASAMSAQDEPFMLTATEDSSTGEVTTSWTNDYVKSINGDTGDVQLFPEDLLSVPQYPYLANDEAFDPQAPRNHGLLVQYSGATDQDYTQGYFYKSVIDTSVPESAALGTVSEVGISNVTLNASTFLSYVGSQDYDESYMFDYDDAEGQWFYQYSQELVGSDLTSYGITYDGTPTDGDSITVEYTAQGYKWEQTDVQPSSGGSSYTAGTGIDITNDVISVTAPVVVNNSQYGLAVGNNATCLTGVALGDGSAANAGFGNVCVAVGMDARAYGWFSVQLGQGDNRDANTLKVGQYVNGSLQNYELLSEGGTVPTDRFTTTPSADGTYVPTLTIASGVATRTWSAPASGTSSISVTLPAASWVNDEQTVTATGVTASNTVIVGAAPASASEYNTCGVICTAQGADSLTFSCSTTPSNDLTVTVLIM